MTHEVHHQESVKPFGDNGLDVGLNSQNLLESLNEVGEVSADELTGRRTWTEKDHESFEDWMETEWFVPFIEQGPGTTEDEVVELFGHIAQLRAALPFTDAERQWLVYSYHHDDAMLGDRERSRLREQEIHLVSGGVRQVVQGRDLMRRWWSWRRQVDEFEGQGSLDMARNALEEISKMCERRLLA